MLSENNLYLNAAADEILSRSDIVGENNFYFNRFSPVVFKKETLVKEVNNADNKYFYLNLFKEIIQKDYPKLKDVFRFFLHRLDILQDMRFYASELEEINKASLGFYGRNFFDVDWIRSSRQKLNLFFEEECNLTNKLSKKTQDEFVRLWGYLFFEKNWFISSWQGVGVTPKGHVTLLDFDFLYPVNDDFKSFIKLWLKKQIEPKNDFEFKLARAIKVLMMYCPEIKITEAWNEYLSQPASLYKPTYPSSNLLNQLKQHGVIMTTHSEINFDKAEDLTYLLDSRRHKNDPRFRKSSVWYWGPLFIVIYVLFRYF